MKDISEIREAKLFSEINNVITLEGDDERFDYKGYKCLIKRHFMGHLCGYIDLFGMTSLQEEIIDSNFYGGITWKDSVSVGFDCAHYQDIVPGIKHAVINPEATYKTKSFVREVLTRTIDCLEEVEIFEK